MKEIHFYESEQDVPGLPVTGKASGWTETEALIKSRTPRINTTQMGLLSTGLFDSGYRVFVHPCDAKSYELRLGSNDCTDKEIRPAHNLFRMWQAGAFSSPGTDAR